MTSLSYRIAHWQPRWRWSLARGLERVTTFLSLFAEAIAESRALERKAHKRYPFAEW